jgi:hypothetical protein
LQIGEGSSAPEGKTNLAVIDIDNSGLQQAWSRLLASCRPAPARPAVASPAADAGRVQ